MMKMYMSVIEPLWPLLLSVTLEGPHPPGTQACPIRASFLPPQAKSQGKPSPPPFTRDWVSPGRECSSPRDRGPIPRTPAAPRWLPRQHSRSPAWWATPRAPCPSGSENVYFCICQFAIINRVLMHEGVTTPPLAGEEGSVAL